MFDSGQIKARSLHEMVTDVCCLCSSTKKVFLKNENVGEKVRFLIDFGASGAEINQKTNTFSSTFSIFKKKLKGLCTSRRKEYRSIIYTDDIA